MKPVLCISRNSLPPVEKDSVVAFDGIFDPSQIHFLNRSLADSKDEELLPMAQAYPQLLPYILVTCNGEYLTYARRGTEDRLHGKRSIGFGGHVEIDDLPNPSNVTSIADFQKTAERELYEELGLKDTTVTITNLLLISNYDRVNSVHVGLIGLCEVDKSLIKPDNLEIINPQWLTASDIRSKIDKYEKWSQLAIKIYS